jgi:uncharacterized membrane protein YqjE
MSTRFKSSPESPPLLSWWARSCVYGGPVEMHSRYSEPNARSIAEVLAEIKDELKAFFETRLQLFTSEMREKIANSKSGAVYAVIALMLGWTGFLMLTLALVALVTVAFWGSPYAWFFGFLIVGFLWTSFAAMLGFAAIRQFKDLAPKETIKVLKQDKVWLKNEVRSQV